MSKKPQPMDYYYKAYYSSFSLTHFFHKPRIDKIVSLVRPKSAVLDIGCGSGIVPYLLSKKGCKVTGVDIRKDCIDFISRKCDGEFICKNALKVNLKRKFDFVISSDVIEHFTEKDRDVVLKVLDKHVKYKGYLVLSFPTRAYGYAEFLWKRIRKVVYPNTKFDDEYLHEIIDKRKLYETLHNYGYFIKERNFLGLIQYIKAKKVIK